MGREVGEKGEGSGGEGGGKWGRRGREVGERGRELGMGYPPVHPLNSVSFLVKKIFSFKIKNLFLTCYELHRKVEKISVYD